ncbi:MAG TPA: zinc-dependent metalloprotease, partial [Gemmataceae bacterium]|nr:zinc-dependent metalloprotease [Gemmataceae bacterium]
MRRIVLVACAALTLTLGWQGLYEPAEAQVPGTQTVVFGPGQGPEPPRFPDFNTVIRGAKTLEGFYKLHHKEDKLYCEILPHQFNQPWLCSISVARGGGLGGHMLNFNEEWVLSFRREGDRVFLVRRNVHYKASAGSPVAKAVETTYHDSILMALRIVTINQMTQGVVINLNDIFLTDFAQLGMGMFDASRSSWHKIKTFPHNNELQVEATFAGGRFGRGGNSIDSRGNTVIVHYGMVQLPDGGYQPRVADDRVGYFLTAVKDFSKESKDTSFTRYVRRWRLEPTEAIDPKNPTKLVAPKKKIVYWIEKSVPNEYRAYVREGILEWNKAFEKIGFRDAIEVRQQEDNEPSSDFDPEDIRYNTFRWITLDAGYAMGPSRANPLTGELIDADIVFDAAMVRYWKQEYQSFSATGEALESPSLIRDARKGIDFLEHPLFQRQLAQEGWNDRPKSATELHEMRMQAIQSGFCQCSSHMKYEIGLAAMADAARAPGKASDKASDELIGQAIKHVTMHEVGHTLGLRHNFKASTMLKNEQLHDTNLTRKQGLVGSVMDYSPVNIAPKGVKQGDYFSQVLGPYDYWAIEYAYKPITGNQDEELGKIAAKIAQPGHEYGTDEDLYLNSDPDINVWDLGSDPMKFGQERMLLAEELLKELHNKIVDKGEGYQRARVALGLLLRQYGDAAQLTVQHVGGEYAHRDHKEDPNARDPLVPVPGAKQRDALKFLQEHILS